ncbi:MFS general substrate transporter [Rhodotorula sp. JG-1b]|nr:MFS general substrate transporter [Rhodotorula sp. JG-1b]
MARPDPPAAPSRQPSRTPLLATHVSGAGPLQGSDDSTAAAELPLLLHDEPASSSPDSENGDDDTDAEARTAVLEANLTPLDAALEKIGMGRYQYQLLVLCGLGWAMDNMTLQTVSVILPRVQEHFQVGDRYIGLLSTSIFAGMMIGAWGWGSFSDAKGRVPAFNLTLAITAVFAAAAAFAPSFGWLCCALFWVGTGIGGSMPTDGTLFLENVPKTRHYLLTALSVFFSLGAIVTSILGLIILPRFSCTAAASETGEACDVATQNVGWRYMLGALAIVSAILCVSRVLMFRLHESPKFLVASNRPSAAVVTLRRISKINGDESPWALSDVVDHHRDRNDVRAVDGPSHSSGSLVAKSPPGYAAMGHTSPETYADRFSDLLAPKWRRTTLFVWTIWTLASAGYTIFNVFLPKFLESKLADTAPSRPTTQEETLRTYVMYTTAGLPGSLVGAYLVETPLGRAKTLAISTLATSAATVVFVFVNTSVGIVLSSMAVSFASTLMYAVIYGFTPEIFPVTMRGTASGIASALSRLSGIVAPLVTGILLSISTSVLPLSLSALCFLATAGAAWGLVRVEERMGARLGRTSTLTH